MTPQTFNNLIVTAANERKAASAQAKNAKNAAAAEAVESADWAKGAKANKKEAEEQRRVRPVYRGRSLFLLFALLFSYVASLTVFIFMNHQNCGD